MATNSSGVIYAGMWNHFSSESHPVSSVTPSLSCTDTGARMGIQDFTQCPDPDVAQMPPLDDPSGACRLSVSPAARWTPVRLIRPGRWMPISVDGAPDVEAGRFWPRLPSRVARNPLTAWAKWSEGPSARPLSAKLTAPPAISRGGASPLPVMSRW